MRIAICDDERVQLDILANAIKNCRVWEQETKDIVRFLSGAQLIRSMEAGGAYDCIFLDIQMPGMNGLDTYESFYTQSKAQVIFVSTHAERIPEVYALHPACFLYKPYDQETFDRTIRVITENNRDDGRFVCQMDGVQTEIPHVQIRYMKGASHYLQIYTDRVLPIARRNLNDAAKELRPYHFFRCHRSYLINLRYYKKRDARSVLLYNLNEEIRIPLSKALVHELDNTYLTYKTEEPL